MHALMLLLLAGTALSCEPSYIELSSGEAGCESAGHTTILDEATCEAAILALSGLEKDITGSTGCAGFPCTYGCAKIAGFGLYALSLNEALIGNSCTSSGYTCLCEACLSSPPAAPPAAPPSSPPSPPAAPPAAPPSSPPSKAKKLVKAMLAAKLASAFKTAVTAGQSQSPAPPFSHPTAPSLPPLA